MDIDRTAPIFGTTTKPDGSCRTSVLRLGDAPDDQDRATIDAIRHADSLPAGSKDRAEHFDAVCSLPPGPFRQMVRDEYFFELGLRTPTLQD